MLGSGVGWTARRRLVVAVLVASLAGVAACSGDGDDGSVPAPTTSTTEASPVTYRYDVPLDPQSPWPKFRANSRQTGASAVAGEDTGAEPWTFPTGKGVFSTPVVGGDGTVYVGSADRSFYAIAPDGTLRWKVDTGEIIDSAALLDDQGRVIVGSGDGTLYALDRDDGAVAWTFEAAPPADTGAFIRWFEGNVAVGSDGTLFAPNDNFCTYAVDGDTGEERWCFATADQTWSLPAVDAATGRLYLGSNFPLAANVFALDAATGQQLWAAQGKGSMVASPMLTSPEAGGLVVLGGFDGIVRALDPATGAEAWTFGARDHIYASPAELPDGTIVQPAADGTVYGLDPADGTVRWTFDALEPIRSSPAVDAAGRVYVGSGEGRLFVLEPDGTLRWSILLIDGDRNDLNASPALGPDGVAIAGESGEVFFVPYDYCLRPEAGGDDRCRVGPGEDLPSDGARLYVTTRFGRLLVDPPAVVDANEPLAFTLSVRSAGATELALLDSASVQVELDPAVEAIIDVSGDRKFVTVVPRDLWAGPAGGTLTVRVTGDYLVGLDRDGLRFSGGTVGGSVDETFTFEVRPWPADAAFPFSVPAAPGDPAGGVELYRLAAPLPTILPSYNQIGFDSIHYLIGMVEGRGDAAVAWAIGGRPVADGDGAEPDPASAVRFPLQVSSAGDLVTFVNEQGFTVQFNNFPLPFDYFRVATRLDASGGRPDSPALNAKAVCGRITFYGQFLQQLGYCNPTTDLLDVFGGAEMRPYDAGELPAGVGEVTFASSAGAVTATLAGSSLPAAEHNLGVLLVDTATGTPLPLAYADATTVSAGADGTVTSVAVALPDGQAPTAVRAYLMVDTLPAARAELTVGG
ncbi:MAG: PQQ-binding-like beta-propeller repeat protein [Acidimicrobiales bacterium]|nr:PQQ-binding-like beta-propeller repeat protein [Acidimicrobiales bacterium]